MALIIEAPQKVSPTVAQQLFTVGSAIAGGLAGFVLARKLGHVTEVPLAPLITATVVSVVATFGAAIALTRYLEKE